MWELIDNQEVGLEAAVGEHSKCCEVRPEGLVERLEEIMQA
jgi:hypothetical protein